MKDSLEGRKEKRKKKGREEEREGGRERWMDYGSVEI